MGRKFSPAKVFVLMVALALSGCAGDAGGAQNTSPSGAPATGTVEAVITILEGGAPLAPANGSYEAFLGTNLTFDASASKGDNLTYSWDFGDGSFGASSALDHAYANAGTFNVSLTVDSTSKSSRATAMVVIKPAKLPNGTVLVWTDQKSFSGDLVIGPAINPVLDCTLPVAEGVYCRHHKVTILDASPDGVPTLAKQVRVSLVGTVGTHTFYVFWMKGTTTLGGTGMSAGPTPNPNRSFTYVGDMPAGEYQVQVRLNIGAAAHYELKVNVDHFNV